MVTLATKFIASKSFTEEMRLHKYNLRKIHTYTPTQLENKYTLNKDSLAFNERENFEIYSHKHMQFQTCLGRISV